MKIGVCLRSRGEIWVRVRSTGEYLVSVYAMGVEFGVRLRYAGQFFWIRLRYADQNLGSVYALQVIIEIRLRSTGEHSGPSRLNR